MKHRLKRFAKFIASNYMIVSIIYLTLSDLFILGVYLYYSMVVCFFSDMDEKAFAYFIAAVIANDILYHLIYDILFRIDRMLDSEWG